RDFARKIQATLTEEDIESAFRRAGMPIKDVPLCDEIVPLDAKSAPMMGSTDVGDVSWVVPTVQARGTTYAIGTPGHSWQLTAQGKTAAAHKGLVHVAKVMACTAVDALQHDVLLRAPRPIIKREWGACLMSARCRANWIRRSRCPRRSRRALPFAEQSISAAGSMPTTRQSRHRARDAASGRLARFAGELTRLALDSEAEFPWSPGRARYPGLTAFEKEDAAVFFGREDDVRDLIKRLNAKRVRGGIGFLAVLGASGPESPPF
ncbi:MAG: hypothetical protein JOZ17_00340, partial [Acetobacteraceae bacterium]|nr:hypothetical protein [Acetobacteraceae bacterium]